MMTGFSVALFGIPTAAITHVGFGFSISHGIILILSENQCQLLTVDGCLYSWR